MARKPGRDIDHLMAAVASHPLRIQILRAMLGEGVSSPAQISRSLREGLSKVAYHTRVLQAHGLVRLSGARSVRGAEEHLYTPVDEALGHPIIKAALGGETARPASKDLDRLDRRIDEGTAAYLAWVGELLDLCRELEASGGLPALGGGVGGRKAEGQAITVFASPVQIELAGLDRPAPGILILARDEAGGAESFVVEAEMAIEALANAEGATRRPGFHVPAYAAEGFPEKGTARAGEARCLTLKIVDCPSSEEEERPRKGLAFELRREGPPSELQPLYSFTMPGIAPILALGGSLLRAGGQPRLLVALEDLGASMNDAFGAINRDIDRGA